MKKRCEKNLRLLVFLIGLSSIFSITVANEQGLPSVPKKQTVLILPFDYDQSPNAELVADQSAWILKKKLKAGKFDLEDVTRDKKKELSLSWKNRLALSDFFLSKGTDWLVTGRVSNIELAKDGIWRGNRFLGMAGIPIKADITVLLHQCALQKDIHEITLQARAHVPRLRVFGLNKDPFPRTPKTVDAFVHDTIMLLSDEITSMIRETGVKAAK
jgi:hypothetical protein